MLLFFVVLPFLPILLQSADPNCRRDCPALLRLILFAFAILSLAPRGVGVLFTRATSSNLPCLLALCSTRRSVIRSSIESGFDRPCIFLEYWHSARIEDSRGDTKDRKKPVRSCVSRKVNFAALWRVLPGRRFGRTRDVRLENSAGTPSSPASSTTLPVNHRRTFSPDESRVLSICP